MSGSDDSGAAPLRVAQLVVALGMGGAEQLAVEIANARARAGDASHLIVMTDPGPLSDRIRPEVGVRYLHYHRVSIRNPLAFFPSLAEGYRRLRRQIRIDRVQLVQSHLPGANLWALVMLLRGACRAVVTVHNNREFASMPGASFVGKLARRWGYKLMLRHCDAVIAVSEAVRRSLLEELGIPAGRAERLVVVTNGVTIPPPLLSGERQRLRAAHGASAEVPLLLAAGRLSTQKNYATLLEAAALLRDRDVAFRLVIGGEGPLREALESLRARLGLQETVDLPGNLGDLRDLMRAADVFVLPSLWEGLPLVLLEAMSCGLPVVGTRIDGVVDVMEEGVQGLLAEPGDAAGLADGLATLLGDAELRHRLGRAGRELVQRDYSFERVSEQLGGIYRASLGEGGRR